MQTGFTIRPRARIVGLTGDGADIVRGQVFEYLLSMRDEVRGSVIDKMRKGVSPMAVSEQASVTADVRSGANPLLRIYSNSVRAAVDEGGRSPGGVPPFGKQSALAAWCAFFLGTTEFHRVRGLALAIAERGQPGPSDRLNRPFGRTQIEFNPVIRAGLKDARNRAVYLINSSYGKYLPRRG